MGASSYVTIQVDEILRETEKALLCKIGDEEAWVPLSQIADADDYGAGDTDVSLSITEWLAREKGLEKYLD